MIFGPSALSEPGPHPGREVLVDRLRIWPCLLAGFAAGVLGCSAGPGGRAAADPTFPGSLHGVAATSSTNAWAVGDYSTPAGQPRTLILHWNGTNWTRA